MSVPFNPLHRRLIKQMTLTKILSVTNSLRQKMNQPQKTAAQSPSPSQLSGLE
jgi:hypothetical protein